MYTLNLEHSFAGAHKLANSYNKKCHNLHGHNWRVIVNIKTSDLIDGMVTDFTKIKEIIDSLDHQYLNEIVEFNPTAEMIAKYLQNQIMEKTCEKRDCYLVEVTIYEADKASVTFS